MGSSARDQLASQFVALRDAAVVRGSPLYEFLLGEIARDIQEGGQCWKVLSGRVGETRGSALPLRFLAAVHDLVLAGEGDELADYYPSVGGALPPQDAWPAFDRLAAANAELIRPRLDDPLQTNEVGRCAALVLGYVAVAHETGLPLSVRELGASAGLNLNWHRFHYRGQARALGPAHAPLTLTELPDELLRGKALPAVATCRGCDSNPLDALDPSTQRRLRACVWPDQERRFGLLDAALEVAREFPPEVAQADALAWAAWQLQDHDAGSALVIAHLVVAQYLSHEARDELAETINEAGNRATAHAPVAWLRLEAPAGTYDAPPRPGLAELTLTSWPGGHERVLCHAGYHGTPIDPAPFAQRSQS